MSYKIPAFLKPYIGTPALTIISFISLLLIVLAAIPLTKWVVTDAVWSGNAEACRAATGACWAYIGVKLNFFIFGFYPQDQHWRAFIAMVILVMTVVCSLVPALWGRKLLLAWLATIILTLWLLKGGLGLQTVATDSWGGLPLTLLLACYGLALAYPLGILLALARTCNIPLFRYVAIALIEGLRGIPFVAILFMASVTLPLLMPTAITPDKLLRAYIGYTLVAAAYFAEGFRGVLLFLPKGQYEAASALGMGYWKTIYHVVLPQCVKSSLPVQVNTLISFFKDTSLVVIIGLTDFLRAVSAGSRDSQWLGFDVEGYAFAALVYFTFCFAMSRYSVWLENRQKCERY